MSDTPIAATPGGDVGQDRSQDRKAGFTPMPERTAPTPKRTERSFETSREAAQELAKKRRNRGETSSEPRPALYADGKGYVAPPNETVSIERAADDLQASRIEDASAKELTDRDNLARDVDAMRAKAGIPTDPTAPVDPNQINPHVFGDLPYLAAQIDPKHLPPDLQPAPPGVDPDLHAAFQNPKIRQAVEAEVNKAFELQAQHMTQIQGANDIAQSAFRAAFPETAKLRPEQVAAFLQNLAQTNPTRYAQVQALAHTVKNAGAARQQAEQRRAHAERQSFERESVNQDRIFDRSIANYTPEHRRAVTGEMVDYAAGLGIE